MTEQYYFSASTNAFYPLSMKQKYDNAGTWPKDAIEISDETFTEYSATPPTGKMRGISTDSNPCWVDIPLPTHDQLVAQAKENRQRLLDYATQQILILQSVTNPDINPDVTEDQLQQLEVWKKYQVALYLINPNAAPDINWPVKPGQ